MSTKTGGSVKAKLTATVVAFAAVTQLPPVREVATGMPLLGSLVGQVPAVADLFQSSEDYATGSDGRDRLKDCSTEQVLKDRKCGNMKVAVINAATMPFIARNIKLAWSEGHKAVLTKDEPGNRAPKYNASCRGGRFVKKYEHGSCDEYEFASSVEGGDGSRVEEVPGREQSCQGGTLSTTYRYVPINTGDQFVVVISNPDKIAEKEYWGVDIAKDQSCGT